MHSENQPENETKWCNLMLINPPLRKSGPHWLLVTSDPISATWICCTTCCTTIYCNGDWVLETTSEVELRLISRCIVKIDLKSIKWCLPRQITQSFMKAGSQSSLLTSEMNLEVELRDWVSRWSRWASLLNYFGLLLFIWMTAAILASIWWCCCDVRVHPTLFKISWFKSFLREFDVNRLDTNDTNLDFKPFFTQGFGILIQCTDTLILPNTVGCNTIKSCSRDF